MIAEVRSPDKLPGLAKFYNSQSSPARRRSHPEPAAPGRSKIPPCRKGSLRQVSSLRQISFGLGKAVTTAGGLNTLRRGGRERLRPLLRRDWQTRPDGLGRYRSARDLVP